MALWQAIRHYDPERGLAFFTYAWRVTQHRIWRSVARGQRPHGCLLASAPPDSLVQSETL